MTNKELVEKYPFLAPKNVWTGEVIEDYDYSITEADAFCEGWWKRFGIPLCDDLKDVLVRNDCLNDFYFTQVKEKFGQLRLYDNGHPQEWGEHLMAWEYISEHTCIECGKFPVPMRDYGWVSPWCDDCFRKAHPDKSEDLLAKWSPKNKDLPDGKPLDYLTYARFSENGREEHKIDMKPYYEKIGYTGEVVKEND